MIIYRLVSGVRDQNLKRRLIAKPEFSFQEALDEACAAELATLSIADLPRGQSAGQLRGESIHCNTAAQDSEEEQDAVGDINCIQGVRKPSRTTTPTNVECRGCGGPHQQSACHFRDVVCRRCSRRGHIA